MKVYKGNKTNARKYYMTTLDSEMEEKELEQVKSDKDHR